MYVEYIEDEGGNLVDLAYYCGGCQPVGLLPSPGHEWPDYDVACAACGEVLHRHHSLLRVGDYVRRKNGDLRLWQVVAVGCDYVGGGNVVSVEIAPVVSTLRVDAYDLVVVR